MPTGSIGDAPDNHASSGSCPFRAGLPTPARSPIQPSGPPGSGRPGNSPTYGSCALCLAVADPPAGEPPGIIFGTFPQGRDRVESGRTRRWAMSPASPLRDAAQRASMRAQIGGSTGFASRSSPHESAREIRGARAGDDDRQDSGSRRCSSSIVGARKPQAAPIVDDQRPAASDRSALHPRRRAGASSPRRRAAAHPIHDGGCRR